MMALQPWVTALGVKLEYEQNAEFLTLVFVTFALGSPRLFLVLVRSLLLIKTTPKSTSGSLLVSVYYCCDETQ